MKPKNDHMQYFRDVVSEKIPACKKITIVAKRILKDLDRKRSKWHYDAELATRYINFVETFCKITTGRSVKGRAFKLEPFQRAITATIFGFVDRNGLRRYQEVFIMMARKNGKTTWAAAIELALLIVDGEGSPAIYNVATTEQQAKKGFNDCMRMINVSPALRKMIKKRTDDLYFSRNMGTIQPLASNTNALDGLDVHGAILDEMAAWKDRRLYDDIKQAIGGRDQPLIISITTNNFVRENIFDAQYEYAEKWLSGEIKEDRFLAIIFELNNRDEWQKPEMWVKANPGLGKIKRLDYMKGSVAKGASDPSYFPTMMTKDFNLKENAASAWLSYPEIENKETFDFAEMGFKYGIGGIDAADSVDLAAACIFCQQPGDDRLYKKSMYWIPESVLEADAKKGNRRERDSVPYSLWVDRGLMRTSPGNKVDKRLFLQWFDEIREEFDCYIFAIGYDPWHMQEDSLRKEYEQFVGKENFIPIIQGAKTMSDPMKSFKVDLAAKTIVNNNNPIDNWCRMNARVKPDNNGNIKLLKDAQDNRKRIDGIAAEIDAYIAWQRKYDDYQNAI